MMAGTGNTVMGMNAAMKAMKAKIKSIFSTPPKIIVTPPTVTQKTNEAAKNKVAEAKEAQSKQSSSLLFAPKDKLKTEAQAKQEESRKLKEKADAEAKGAKYTTNLQEFNSGPKSTVQPSKKLSAAGDLAGIEKKTLAEAKEALALETAIQKEIKGLPVKIISLNPNGTGIAYVTVQLLSGSFKVKEHVFNKKKDQKTGAERLELTAGKTIKGKEAESMINLAWEKDIKNLEKNLRANESFSGLPVKISSFDRSTGIGKGYAIEEGYQRLVVREITFKRGFTRQNGSYADSIKRGAEITGKTANAILSSPEAKERLTKIEEERKDSENKRKLREERDRKRLSRS